MAAVVKRSIELTVQGGQTAVTVFEDVGAKGEKALRGIGTAAQTANDNVERLGRTGGQAGNALKAGFSNLGLQLQDVVVQAQAGTSAFTILAQQGPQIASGFAFLNPMVGVVVALGAAAAGVAVNMLGVKDSADLAKTASESLQQAQEALRGTIAGQASDITRLAGEYRKLGAEMRIVERIKLESALRDQEKALRDQRAAVLKLGDEFKDTFDAVLNPVASEQIDRRRGDVPPAVAERIRQIEATARELNAFASDEGRGFNSLLIGLRQLEDTTPGAAKVIDPLIDRIVKATRGSDDFAKSVEKTRYALAALRAAAEGKDGPAVPSSLLQDAKAADAYGDSVKRLTTDLLKVKDARKGFIQEQLDRLPANATAEQRAEVARLAGEYFDAEVAAKATHKAQVEGARTAKRETAELVREHERDLEVLERLKTRADAITNDVGQRIKAAGDRAVGQLSDSGQRDPAMVAAVREAAEANERDAVALRNRTKAQNDNTQAQDAALRVIEAGRTPQEELVARLGDIEAATTTLIRLNPQLADTYRQAGEAAKQAAREQGKKAIADAERAKMLASILKLEGSDSLTDRLMGGAARGFLDLKDQVLTASERMRKGVVGFAETASDAFAEFAMTGKANIKGLVASVLADFAQLQARQAILQLITWGGKALFSWYTGTATTGATTNHTGGMVGDGPRREIPAALVATAPRAHRGLMVDERVIVAQTGERVLNREQTREWNAGRRGAGLTINHSPVFNISGYQDPATIRAIVEQSSAQARGDLARDFKSNPAYRRKLAA